MAGGDIVQCFIRTKHQQGDAVQGGVLLEDDLVHLAPRYAGTPLEFWGHRLTRWPGAPRVHDKAEMRELVARLRDAPPLGDDR